MHPYLKNEIDTICETIKNVFKEINLGGFKMSDYKARIGIIGKGFVGTAFVAHGFSNQTGLVHQ